MLLSDDPFTSMPDVTDPFSQEHSLNSVPASKYSMPLEQTFPMHAHHPSASTFSWSNASRQRPKSFLPSLSTMAALTRGATFPGRPASTQANSMSTAKRTKLPTRGSEENQTPSQARLPTTFPGTNCGPTLNRFVASHPYLDPELLTKDPSSQDLSHELPSMYGSVEYRSSDKTQHPLRRMSRTMIDFAGSTTRPNALSQRCDVASPVEIIDVDALSPDKTPKPTIPTMPTLSTARLSPFKLCHKPATSSMDSTRRLENALFHALTDGDGQPGADFNVGLGMAGLPMMNAGEDDGDVLLAPVSPGEAKEVGGEGREIGSKRKASDEGGDNGDDDDEDDGEGRSRKRERSADEGSGVGDEGEKREDSLNKD